MGKQTKAMKSPPKLGKGKVTPVQIAFIVDRYLAENSYSTTLTAFRAEAADLFSKTKGKEPPKGLLGLADILDEYISLKEQKVIVDQEKRRVEMALQGLQSVMQAYQSGGVTMPLLLPSSPQFTATPNATFDPVTNPGDGSSPGHTIHGNSMLNCAQASMLPLKAAEPNFTTPKPNSSSAEKRKASRSAAKIPPAPKKSRTQALKGSCTIEGATLPSEVTCTYKTGDIKKLCAGQTILQSQSQASSVAKSLFKQPAKPRSSSSPKTPPQGLPFQTDKCVSPLENPSLNATDASANQKISSSNCSVISSERIIISPLKHNGYYAVERSYRVSSSPLKPNEKKVSNRDHVKGRLDFDESDAQMCSEKPASSDSSPSSTDEITSETFDFELPDFDIFDGDLLSKLLVDIDLECGVSSCQQASDPANFIVGEEHNVESGCWETNQASSDSHLPTVTGIISEKDMDIQGPDSMTSVRSVTKCIRIVSPAKPRRNCSVKLAESPLKQ